jgi:hypothetical protein
MPNADSHPGVAAAKRLRRVADALASAAVEPDDASWLVAGLAHYLSAASKGVDLDAALGLAVGVGGTPWWSAQAISRCDDLIRQLAASIADTDDRHLASLQRDGLSVRPAAAADVAHRPAGGRGRAHEVVADRPGAPVVEPAGRGDQGRPRTR